MMRNRNDLTYQKRKNNKKYTNEFSKFLGTNREIFTAMRELITIAPAIGVIIGSFILYRYFDINDIAQQPIDTFTILVTSLNFLVLISTLSGLLIISTVFTYTVLKELKDKKEIPNLWKYGLIRISIFYSIFTSMIFVDAKYHIEFGTLLIPILLILFFTGVKYIYSEDKFLKQKVSNSAIMSIDIVLIIIPLLILSLLFIAIDEDNYQAIALIYVISFMLFSLPYLYLQFTKIRSNTVFTVHMFSIAVLLLFMIGSPFFIQRTVQILNIGAKPYFELILKKSECDRLKNNIKLGYLCDENNTLKDMFGVWLVGDKPIFQKLKKHNSLSMPKADKNSTKIWIHRDKIQSVL